MSGTFSLEVDVPLAGGAGRVGFKVKLPNLGATSTEDLEFIQGMLDVLRRMADHDGVPTLEPPVPRALPTGDTPPPSPAPGAQSNHAAAAPPVAPPPQARPSTQRPVQAEGEQRCELCPRKFPTPHGLSIHTARQHPTPKVCAEEGCATVLSKFNPTRWCAIHEGLHAPATIGRTG